MSQVQTDLFEERRLVLPAGFRYQPALIDAAEERRLLDAMRPLTFKPFEFQGFLGNREVVSFGWSYDFSGGGLQKTDDMPEFLLPLRAAASAFSGIAPAQLQQALLTRYPPGAAIGWHKDRSVFGEVIGISLLSPCTLRFRKKVGAKWERASIVVEPRSAYLLQGPARTEWQHGIPAVEALRYSITFRNLKE
jgi:alkylated DNA repair dioxygenase AlkB